MSEINDLVLEEFIAERTFKSQLYRRTAQSQRGRATGGKIRQLSKGSALSQQISRTRAKLNSLLARQRQTYGGRAKAEVMKS